jgi:predicted nuclease with TOPRIM domain
VTDDRADLMLEILKNIQADIHDIKHEVSSVNTRVSALEDHFRGTLTTLYGIQADVSRLKDRVDRIEQRLGLRDTEH